jgi:hypothetical protein
MNEAGSRYNARRRKEGFTVKLMRIVAEAAIVGALGFTAFGLGAGVANANPPSPGVAGIPLPQDKPHGEHGDGDGGDWGNRGDWGGGGNWGVPGSWNGGGPFGCISGPVGWGTGFICI